MAEHFFDDWKSVLQDFKDSVEKDLEEIHKQKDEVTRMKTDIFDRLDNGKYITDEHRIVLSAPEIIIGNVDKSGMLKGGSKIVIRGNDIGLEAAGKEGSISSRATHIGQTAVDPGIDGQENVVYPGSSVVTQARAVTIQSNDATDAFSAVPSVLGESGVFIHADKTVAVDSAVSSTIHKANIESAIAALKKQKEDLKKASDGQMKEIDSFFSLYKKITEKEEDYTASFETIRGNMLDMEYMREQVDDLMPSIYRVTVDFIRTVSKLAEVSRQIKAFEAEKGAIVTGEDFKKKTTSAAFTLKAEQIRVDTFDGDGNLRTNEEAGISVRAPRMGVSMRNPDGTLVKDGSFGLSAENIDLSTSNPSTDGKTLSADGRFSITSKDISLTAYDYESKETGYTENALAADGKISFAAKTIEVGTIAPSGLERDDKGKLTKGEYKAEGDVFVRSKNISMETIDYEVGDGELKVKTLTKGSTVAIRSEKVDMMAVDEGGKATGSISVNAKAVSVKSMDVDKESLADSGLASGSTMVLVSEKVSLGQKTGSEKSKAVQVVGDKVGVFADTTFEAQQDKGVVQLTGGNANLAGGSTQIYGTTTINAATTVKAELKAPSAAIDNLEAKTSFKSPNISDGVSVPGSPSSASLSTKLKAEDVK